MNRRRETRVCKYFISFRRRSYAFTVAGNFSACLVLDRASYTQSRPSARGRDQPQAATNDSAIVRQAPSIRAPPPPPTATGATGGGPRSLSEVVGNRAGPSAHASSPFATDDTAESLRAFDDLERQLTVFMTEKSALDEELSRLDLLYLFELCFIIKLMLIIIDYCSEEGKL